MQKRVHFYLKIIIFLVLGYKSEAAYFDQYMVALQDLIKVHKKYFPDDPIVMNNTSLVFSVYKKIITPWALQFNGMAYIVQNKFYSKFSYSNDVSNLWKNFIGYQNQIRNLKQYFSDVPTSQLLDAFYQQIGQDVVQIFFNIIQQSVDELTTESQALESCYLLYQMAYQMYQPDMVISGIQEGSDFSATISGNMIILYQNSIQNLLNQLSIGMLGSTTIEKIYNQIAHYYMYLADIATNVNDVALISSSQVQAQQACQNYGYYLQAQKLYQQAENLLKKYPTSVALQINNTAIMTSSLEIIGSTIAQIFKLAEQAEQYYSNAQDIFGQNQAKFLYTLVNNVDLWVVQGIAQLWLLYLQDQSSQNQYTAPTIASFIAPENQNSSNPVTNDQIIASFQNLSALIEQKTNTINALSTIPILKTYSIQEIINSLKQQIISLEQSGVLSDTSYAWMNGFVSIQAINTVQDILFYLNHLSQSIVNTLSGSGSVHALRAMAYAQALDETYKGLSSHLQKQINSLVPYFPDQLQTFQKSAKSQPTWFDWAESILLVSLTVDQQDLQIDAIAKVQIEKPTQEKLPSKKDINDITTSAYQNALNGNYVQAANQYQQLMNLYTTLYAINPSDKSIYTQMMQAKTMYSALSFTATIQPSGNQTWGTIKNIPEHYTATKYGFSDISVSDLAMSELPPSLLTMHAGTKYTTFTQQQKEDLLQIIQAHFISQLLAKQGINFSDIFVDYKLQFKSPLDQAGADLAKQIHAQVQVAFNQFDGTDIISIVLADASKLESIICKNIAVSAVNPLVASMATALTFYASAQLLVAPNKNEIKLGNASYVSGNDAKLSNIFLNKMAQTYLSAAYPHWQEAKNLMQQLNVSLKNNANKEFPSNFENNLKIVDAHIWRSKALLYAPDQSAYAYSVKASDQNTAQEIETLFFGIYQEYIAWMKQCLIGKNPFDPTYQILLHKIDSVYVSWAALLQNKSSKVQEINNDIINLFTKAGQGCMNISYQQSLYPKFNQYHYATAAHYFLAVQMQYNKMKELSKAASMNALVNDAYFKGSSQNIALFLHVQKNGVTITHETTQQQQNVAFPDLISQKVFASTAKQDAYNSVQNLLLNAGIGYLFLKSRVNKIVSKTTIAQQAKSTLTAPVSLYLQNQNIIGSQNSLPSYFNLQTIAAIFATNIDAYEQFKNSPEDYASWLDVVYSALQALYAINYMGAQQGEIGQEMENQITQFFTALEQHTSSLENPSSFYVG